MAVRSLAGDGYAVTGAAYRPLAWRGRSASGGDERFALHHSVFAGAIRPFLRYAVEMNLLVRPK